MDACTCARRNTWLRTTVFMCAQWDARGSPQDRRAGPAGFAPHQQLVRAGFRLKEGIGLHQLHSALHRGDLEDPQPTHIAGTGRLAQPAGQHDLTDVGAQIREVCRLEPRANVGHGGCVFEDGDQTHECLQTLTAPAEGSGAAVIVELAKPRRKVPPSQKHQQPEGRVGQREDPPRRVVIEQALHPVLDEAASILATGRPWRAATTPAR